MFASPDAPFNPSFLNDAFDYSRYPIFKSKDIPFSTLSGRPIHQQTFFASFKESSPSKENRRHSRNVSEPQLIPSTTYAKESWYANFGPARTVADIVNLSAYNDVSTTLKRNRNTVGGETLFNAQHDVQEALPLLLRDSQDTSRCLQSSDHEDGEEDSLYSMDSADQEAHTFLLSMPVIPKIKLERKATVRKTEPGPLWDDAQKYLLSPRVKTFRTPAGVSSRRYGHIGSGTNSEVVGIPPMTRNKSTSDVPRKDGRNQDRGTETQVTIRGFSASSNSSEISESDDEQQPLLKKDTVESPHADVLLSFINEVGSSPPSLDETSPHMRAPPKHPQRSHRRSTATQHSLSFSSLVHAVADGCASLDTILRKPKPKPKTKKQTTKAQISIQNAPKPTSKWAPKNDRIVIKVFVPSTDDIWAFHVPENVTLVDFTSQVVSKLKFAVSFSGSLWDEPRYHFGTNEQFRAWVKRRVRFGRNLPIVAHVVAPLQLIKLSVGADGCEIWCYA